MKIILTFIIGTALSIFGFAYYEAIQAKEVVTAKLEMQCEEIYNLRAFRDSFSELETEKCGKYFPEIEQNMENKHRDLINARLRNEFINNK